MKTRITIYAVAITSLLLAVAGCEQPTGGTNPPPIDPMYADVVIAVTQSHPMPQDMFTIYLDGDLTHRIHGQSSNSFERYPAPWHHVNWSSMDVTYHPNLDQTWLEYTGWDYSTDKPVEIDYDPVNLCYFGFYYECMAYPHCNWLKGFWTDTADPYVMPSLGFQTIKGTEGVTLHNATNANAADPGAELEIWDVGYLFFDERQPHENVTLEGMPPEEFTRPDPDIFPQPFVLPPGEDASFDIPSAEITGNYYIIFFSSREYNPDVGTEEIKVWAQFPVEHIESE